MNKETQSRAILAYLKEGNTLNPLQALQLFGTMKLSTRVSELRRQGENIEKIPTTTASGKRVMTYKIAAL